MTSWHSSAITDGALYLLLDDFLAVAELYVCSIIAVEEKTSDFGVPLMKTVKNMFMPLDRV